MLCDYAGQQESRYCNICCRWHLRNKTTNQEDCNSTNTNQSRLALDNYESRVIHCTVDVGRRKQPTEEHTVQCDLKYSENLFEKHAIFFSLVLLSCMIMVPVLSHLWHDFSFGEDIVSARLSCVTIALFMWSFTLILFLFEGDELSAVLCGIGVVVLFAQEILTSCLPVSVSKKKWKKKHPPPTKEGDGDAARVRLILTRCYFIKIQNKLNSLSWVACGQGTKHKNLSSAFKCILVLSLWESGRKVVVVFHSQWRNAYWCSQTGTYWQDPCCQL